MLGICCSAHITNCIAACETQDTAHDKPNFILVIANFALFLFSFSSLVFLFLVHSLKLDSFSFYWAVSCLCAMCMLVEAKVVHRFPFFFSSFPSPHCTAHACHAITQSCRSTQAFLIFISLDLLQSRMLLIGQLYYEQRGVFGFLCGLSLHPHRHSVALCVSEYPFI